jgi:hypothetical protein
MEGDAGKEVKQPDLILSRWRVKDQWERFKILYNLRASPDG